MHKLAVSIVLVSSLTIFVGCSSDHGHSHESGHNHDKSDALETNTQKDKKAHQNIIK